MLVAATALLLVAPSASAMSWVPPTKPTATCPVTPPGQGSGVVKEVQDIAHEGTSATCAIVDDGKSIAGIAYDLAIAEVNLVMTVISPFVDGTQDNVCEAVYGDPNAPQAGCRDIVLSMDFVAISA